MSCECLRNRQHYDPVAQLLVVQAQAQQGADLAPAPQAAEQMPAAAPPAPPAAPLAIGHQEAPGAGPAHDAGPADGPAGPANGAGPAEGAGPADGAGPAAAGLVERLLALEITLQRIVDAEAPQRRRMQERMVALEQIEGDTIDQIKGLQLRITALEDANDDLRTRLREALSERLEV